MVRAVTAPPVGLRRILSRRPCLAVCLATCVSQVPMTAMMLAIDAGEIARGLVVVVAIELIVVEWHWRKCAICARGRLLVDAVAHRVELARRRKYEHRL